MAASLQSIVDDILIHILRMLPLGDVLSVRQTSKRLEVITYLRTIWHDQFRFEVLFKGLPIPGTIVPLSKIPALDLEWRTRLAVQVHKMWTRPVGPLRPVLQRTIPPAQQIALRIGGREILTLHTNMFTTWHLDGANELSTGNIMLEYGLEAGNTWKIHKDLGDSDTIAIASSSGEDFFILAGAWNEPPLRRQYPGRVLGLLDKFVLILTSPESGGNIDIYNWGDTPLGVSTIQSYPQFFGNLITFAKFDSHLIVVWEACLTMHPIPTLPEAGQSTTLSPTQVFFFQSPIQAPVVCSPCTPSNLPDSGPTLSTSPKRSKALTICYRIAGMVGVHGSVLTRSAGGEEADGPTFRLFRTASATTDDCICMRVGQSGRGLWSDSHNNFYRCSTVSTVTCGGDECPTLDIGQRSSKPLCTLPGILKDCHDDWVLDFDEGMGRIVYCDEAGHISIVDVV